MQHTHTHWVSDKETAETLEPYIQRGKLRQQLKHCMQKATVAEADNFLVRTPKLRKRDKNCN